MEAYADPAAPTLHLGGSEPQICFRPRPRWRPLYAAGCRRGRIAQRSTLRLTFTLELQPTGCGEELAPPPRLTLAIPFIPCGTPGATLASQCCYPWVPRFRGDERLKSTSRPRRPLRPCPFPPPPGSPRQ